MMEIFRILEVLEFKLVLLRFFEDVGEDVDEDLKLDGWFKFIFVMIYECFFEVDLKWKFYFDVIFEIFEIFMFWLDEEVEQLQVSVLCNKIGRDSVEIMFCQKVLFYIWKNFQVF